MRKVEFVKRGAFQRVGFFAVLMVMICLTCITNAQAYEENQTIDDYRVVCTVSKPETLTSNNYRVMIRIRNNVTRNYLKIFPMDRLLQFKALTLDFEDITFTESDTKSYSMQKFFQESRYLEAICFAFNAFHTLNDKLKAAFGNETIVGFSIQEDGIEFNTPIPTETFTIDTFDTTNLFNTERELYDRTTRYINNQ